MTNLQIAVNTGTADLEYGVSGAEWTDVSVAADTLIFTAGSNVVADGQPIPSSSDLNRAGVVITSSPVPVAHYLLADASANLLKEIHLAGNQNKQYVFAFDFDDVTASEPVLEVWDDSGLDTTNSNCLGAGISSNSWIQGFTTTSALPGVDWVGSRLAGASAGHYLELNDGTGGLLSAQTLYCQLKVTVPASFGYAGAENPVFVVKYSTT